MFFFADWKRIYIFAVVMQRLKHICVWLSRIMHCRGFGIQSPSDYWVARYVINEHWPYYQYAMLGQCDSWLQRKMGRLYFRLANWCQPKFVVSDNYREYLLSGCRHAKVLPWRDYDGQKPDMIVLRMGDDIRNRLALLYNKVYDQSVLVIEDIWHDKEMWSEIVADKRTGVTFDLYYCGLVFFDKKRTKQHYIINF